MFIHHPKNFGDGCEPTGTAAASTADLVIALVSREHKVPAKLIVNSQRCRANASQARHLAMYLMHVVFGEKLAAVGDAFGRDRTTVAYACRVIEDQRDDPQFDREVDRLEALLTGGGNG